jgi:dienelactone hydrolase
MNTWNTLFRRLVLLGAVCLVCASLAERLRAQAEAAPAAVLPAHDLRLGLPQTLDSPRVFPELSTPAQWVARAREIREQVLTSCGLAPMPKKTALKPRFLGKVERADYSIEKVAIETLPGFFLAGNLYRPLGHGEGPFPAVLNPHGHWDAGRLTDTEEESMLARCVHLARHGVIVFAIDMVGYNDTIQIPKHREFALNPTNQLWNISLMGLQTWNCVRALDFLVSLPDVDRERLACTGASGGGTQTFMLGAIDDRLKAQAPIVMVSSTMQGGCLCENAPGLRVDYSNMELAAAAAPRPQLLVAATGDWTKMTLTVEGPAIAKVYDLLQATNQFRYVRHDFKHNYNRTSRESVYAWFNEWLLPRPDPDMLTEKPHAAEAPETLRLWPDGKLPTNAIGAEAVTEYWAKSTQDQFDALWPTNRPMRGPFKSVYLSIWRHTLQSHYVTKNHLLAETNSVQREGGRVYTEVAFGRQAAGDRVSATLVEPDPPTRKGVVILVNPEGRRASFKQPYVLQGVADTLVGKGFSVLLIDTFLTGEQANPAVAAQRQTFTNFFTTYNRTDTQERVQDIITASAFARFKLNSRRTVFLGTGRAGLWVLMAAPVGDVMVADCDQLEVANDAQMLAPDVFVPGIRRIGAFEGIVALASPKPLLMHNAGKAFPLERIRSHYAATTLPKYLLASETKLSDAELANWIEVQARW